MFDTVSEATFTGRVTDRASGKSVTATSGVIAYADADGLLAFITYGVRDLKVSAYSRVTGSSVKQTEVTP